jgi:hypothetical protein
MVISIDYDKTWTQDPAFWREMVYNAKARHHTIIMVTQRCVKYEAEMRETGCIPDDLQIVFASGRTKKDAAEKAGYAVDVWIDDYPLAVYDALTYRDC